MCPNCNHVFEIDGHVSSHNVQSLRKVFGDNGFDIIYLNNFNYKYAIKKQRNLTRKILIYIYHGLFGKHLNNGQIEYIVKPKQ